MPKPLPKAEPDADEGAALLALFLAEHERLQAALQAVVDAARGGGSADGLAPMDALLRELAVHAAVEDELLCPYVRRQLSADGLVDPADLEPSIVPQCLAAFRLAGRHDRAAAGRSQALGDELFRHLAQAIAVLEAPQRGWCRPRLDFGGDPAADEADL